MPAPLHALLCLTSNDTHLVWSAMPGSVSMSGLTVGLPASDGLNERDAAGEGWQLNRDAAAHERLSLIHISEPTRPY